jgi:hypothetical protein
MGQDLFAGPWKSRLERLVAALRTVHKSLIDSTQREYEKLHGRVESPYALFRLAAQDPAFAWLRPMTRLIVELEESPDRRRDLEDARRKIRDLLAAGEFSTAYQARVQSEAAVAAEHGRLQAALKQVEGSGSLPPGE